MKNITLSLVGQSILTEILTEIQNSVNIQVEKYENFNNFNFKILKQANKIIITSIENYDFVKDNEIINSVIFIKKETYLNKEKFNDLEIINLPVQIKTIIEKIKLIYLKTQFLGNSNIDLLDYKINHSNLEVTRDHNKLKLIEREIDLLLFLKKSKNPQSINSILESVWGYSKGLETHTIETHVHRLRKKFFNSFQDKDLIKNNKDGYFV